MTNDFLYRSNSKIYEKEPWYNLAIGPSLYQGSTVTGRVYSTEADQRVRFTRSQLYTAISGKVVGKIVHATIPKDNMGYDQFTVSDIVAVEPTFVTFL